MSYTLKFFEYIGFNNKIVGERFFARNREENKMLKKLKPILKISITSVLFSGVFIFSQDQCPPAFISGVPLNQSVALSWEKPDTLSGFGVEVYSQCFTTCSSDGMTIEHIGQDSSGGWFRDNDGLAVDCDTDLYACSDAANESWLSEQFGAVALWSDTTAPANSRMSTELIDLTSYTSASLFFDEYIDYSDFAHDSNFVEISTDGSNWTTVHYSNPMTLGDGYFSNHIDLSDYAGQSIYIGFRYYDPLGYGCNWFVDNIRVFGGDGSAYSNPCGTLLGYRVYKDGSMVAFVEDNEYTADGLTNNVEYCFKVSASYASGESEFAFESCYAPIDPFILSETSFSDTLDPTLGENSTFEFTLINLDTPAHSFSFTSEGLATPTAENTLLSNTFDTQETSTSFFDAGGNWSWGTPETANGSWLEFPNNTGGFFFYNDAEEYYTGTNPGYYPTDITLQSQALPYNGDGPVYFIADIYFVNPFGDCTTGDSLYAESASIVVSTDNGATWTVVDSTFATRLEWDGYLPVDWADANWHTMTYDLTPYISPGIFTVGIRYTDCGGNFAYGIGVDNVNIIKGDNSSWLTMERSAGEIAAKDTMSMSLTMMPREDQNHIITSQLAVGPEASFDIDIAMITDPSALGVEDLIADEFALNQNYPNPFNPVTSISYNLPKDERVKIIISDIMGKRIKTLINKKQISGQKTIQWDATNDFGNQVSAGIYFLTIEAGSFTKTNKMILLK